MNKQQSSQEWNPGTYDTKLGFVSKLGQGILEWLDPKAGERILDLGCGTGDLAAEIAGFGSIVTGMDQSEPMIATARNKYPAMSFLVGDGEHFKVDAPFDAVFSNAALHWMTNATGVIESVREALKDGGRFVAEFGGKGNVDTFVRAFYQVMPRYDVNPAERDPWFFPSIGEYAGLLEQNGFEVRIAEHFDRPTPLPEGEKGVMHWLDGFGDAFFKGMDEAARQAAKQEVYETARQQLQVVNGVYQADYRRIRVAAVKL
ncbi:methyltransferase domain-containing protein [Paenibacillus glycanilyticus]|uniref:class I SAM-dependent methyltransferase n=1 Tax=Paenibacillus glycanilyticus TaxID=126569 RepID=UPI00203C434D|nr:class I SAM-dependent methyltransferase [Paenibacillus glycanilyticus]MCM3626348.1 methyltransferase domain-containing protein [Paenibacillus glycanilyticus]